MPVAFYNNTLLAECEQAISYDYSYYFPPDSLKRAHFKKSKKTVYDPAIGLASFYTIEVDGRVAKDCAWYYPEPKEWAAHIKDHIAFRKTRITIMD